MLTAVNLKCGNMVNPIGITQTQPEFSWVIESDGSNVIQQSYKIQVALDKNMRQLLWDSGPVHSKKSVHVGYCGEKLRASTRYYYRVRISDYQNNRSNWSEIAFFETGLLNQSDWIAKLISVKSNTKDGFFTAGYLRKEFASVGSIRSARAYAAAYGAFEIYINGSRVCDAVASMGLQNDRDSLAYQTFDITQYVNEGPNAVGVILGRSYGNAFDETCRNDHAQSITALIMQLRIEYEDGRIEIIGTDETWKTGKSPLQYSDTLRGEHYDARLEMCGWDIAGYDNAAWIPAEAAENGLPMMYAMNGPLIKRKENLKACGVFKSPAGKCVIDFGQTIIGWIQFKVSGRRGERVVIRYADALETKGNFSKEAAPRKNEYILKGEVSESYEPHFIWMRFRYAVIEAYPGEVIAENFRAVSIYPDITETGDFYCSDEKINKLYRYSVREIKDNIFELAFRQAKVAEHTGWAGYSDNFYKKAASIMDISGLYRQKAVEGCCNREKCNLADEEEDGKNALLSILCIDTEVICPWSMLKMYGDKRLLEKQYEAMKHCIERVCRLADMENLLINGGNPFAKLRVEPLSDGTPGELLLLAYLAHGTGILSYAANALSAEQEEKEYAELRERLTVAFDNIYFLSNGEMTVRTQTAYAVALYLGLTPEACKNAAVDTMVRLIQENKWQISSGFFGMPYFFYALCRNNRADIAYRLMVQMDNHPALYPVQKSSGSDEICMYWNSGRYSLYGNWLFEDAAGLRVQDDIIWIKPKPCGDLKSAYAEQMTSYGLVFAGWEFLPGGEIMTQIMVPHNTTAIVMLPFESVRTIEPFENVYLSKSSKGVGICLGSGKYVFKSKGLVRNEDCKMIM